MVERSVSVPLLSPGSSLDRQHVVVVPLTMNDAGQYADPEPSLKRPPFLLDTRSGR